MRRFDAEGLIKDAFAAYHAAGEKAVHALFGHPSKKSSSDYIPPVYVQIPLNKQSSTELATLASKYLDMDEIGYAQHYRDNPGALWADVRSLAASVLSQADGE